MKTGGMVMDLAAATRVFILRTDLGERARWVNIALSNLKRSLDRTYHVFGFFKYAHRYLSEAAWRVNRRFQLDALVPRLLGAAARCPTWTERRLRVVPVLAD